MDKLRLSTFFSNGDEFFPEVEIFKKFVV